MASGRRRTRRRTGVFKGELRTTRFRAGVETPPAPDKRLARPSRPPRLFERHGPGGGWLNVGQVSGRDLVGWLLAHRDPGPRPIRVMLGRAAAQDDGDAFALVWNPEDGGSPSPAPQGAGALARQGKGKAWPRLPPRAGPRPAPSRPVSSRQKPKRKAPARARGPGGGFDKRPCYSAAKPSASPGAAGAAARVWRATASGATVSGEPASSWGGRTRRNSGATALDRWAVAKGLRV